MDITEASILHHVGIVLALLWILTSVNCCHPVMYFISLIYLYQVYERYILRLHKKLQFEERKEANQRRVLSDSETVRWLNHAVEKIWPICMEQIASQKFLLPIIPWFLDKYKPWTAKKAVFQSLYLGRKPPMFTEIRVLRQSNEDDHLVLELGMNFLSADDMSAILAVKLRKRLGFGISAKLHVTGMHVEGKVLVGVRFLKKWPFLSRLRICFVEPPYFQMTVKPIFNHGVDVTELPGIAGWMDKLLAVAFEDTLVEPNMLVVDVEKFVASPKEGWFSVDEKEPIAHARVEIIEAENMKPSDPNGFADPYVKGQLGPYRFRTKTQKKTLAPIWQEEFKIPICSWESSNMLVLEVRDKDHLSFDDTLGNCSININDLRGRPKDDIWMSLQNIKMGRLHIAVTVVDVNVQDKENLHNEEPSKVKEDANDVENKTTQKDHDSSVSLKQSPKMEDKFEPINIEGQNQTGIWVHHPGSDISPTWDPRKGKNRQTDTQIHGEDNDSSKSSLSQASGSHRNDDISTNENPENNKLSPLNTVRKGLQKFGSIFHRSPSKDDHENTGDPFPTPRVNLRAVNEKMTSVRFIVDDEKDPETEKKSLSPERNSQESPGKGTMKGMAKSIIKHAGKSAHDLKHALSRKGSKKSNGYSESVSTEVEDYQVSDVSDEDKESLSSSKGHSPRVEGIPIFGHGPESPNCKEQNTDMKIEEPLVRKLSFQGVEGENNIEVKNDNVHDGVVEEPLKPKLPEGNLEGG